MLRTNSRQAKANIRNYITENFDGTSYGIETPSTFEGIAAAIHDTFYDEMVKFDRTRRSETELFFNWCAGLPSILDTCYYYNRSAVNDLAAILEETEAEASKYNESQAEATLTGLIYREIMAAL